MSREPTPQEVHDLVGEALRPPDRQPDPARLAAFRRQVIDSAASRADAPIAPGAHRPDRSARGRWTPARPSRRMAGALGGTLAAACAALVVFAVLRPGPDLPDGFAGVAVSPGGAPGDAASAQVQIAPGGGGHVVRISTTDLPRPDGFYEMWFARTDPATGLQVVSAGTFRPDGQGRVDARFDTAVDPADFQLVLVTREPLDGDPLPTTDVVLQLELPPA